MLSFRYSRFCGSDWSEYDISDYLESCCMIYFPIETKRFTHFLDASIPFLNALPFLQHTLDRMMEEDRRMRDIEFRRQNNDILGRIEERDVLDRMDELILEHDSLRVRLDAMEHKAEETQRRQNERTDDMLRTVHQEQQQSIQQMMESVLTELQMVQDTLVDVQLEQRGQGGGGTRNPNPNTNNNNNNEGGGGGGIPTSRPPPPGGGGGGGPMNGGG